MTYLFKSKIMIKVYILNSEKILEDFSNFPEFKKKYQLNNISLKTYTYKKFGEKNIMFKIIPKKYLIEFIEKQKFYYFDKDKIIKEFGTFLTFSNFYNFDYEYFSKRFRYEKSVNCITIKKNAIPFEYFINGEERLNE